MLAGTGIYGKPLDALARLLASSATWQSITRAADEEDALKSIHIPVAFDSDEQRDRRPRAIIAWSAHSADIKGSQQIRTDGTIELSIEIDPEPQYKHDVKSAFLDFCNKIGAIVFEMAENSAATLANGSGTYLNAVRFTLLEGPAPSIPDEEQGELFFGVAFQVDWT